MVRQALAGMLWSKQFYHYDLDKWLAERGSDPYKLAHKRASRNDQWHHMYNGDVLSMPDKWEYPWYAAWDLAFHVLALTMVDVDFGKEQLRLMLREPAHASQRPDAGVRMELRRCEPAGARLVDDLHLSPRQGARKASGTPNGSRAASKKLLMNFTWWVDRKIGMAATSSKASFLGLDNIGVFDRSAALPTGGFLEQADGTAWMALFADNMLEIAIELAKTDDDYVDMVLKFLQHDAMITSSLVQLGEGTGMWDEEDGFFYDVLRLPDGTAQRLKVRSMVGLLPFCAATPFEPALFDKYPEIAERFQWFLDARPALTASIHPTIPEKSGMRRGERNCSARVQTGKLKLRRLLSRSCWT